MLQVKQVAYR